MTPSPPRRACAFTIVEMLVSMALVLVLVSLFVKAFSDVSTMSGSLKQQADTMTSGRAVLDRIGAGFRNMVQSGEVGLIAGRNVGAGSNNDALAFVSQARTRARAGVDVDNVRFAVNGFGVKTLPDSVSERSAPLMSWGEGIIVYEPVSVNQTVADVQSALTMAAVDLAADDLTGDMLQFSPLGDGVFRFEICYLLDDGTLVSVPPAHVNMNPGGGAQVYGIPLRKVDSADANGRYVKALVVGVAIIDGRARLMVEDIAVLGSLFPNPPAGKTPLESWDLQSPTASVRSALAADYPLPVVNGIRVYQQYYYVQ